MGKYYGNGIIIINYCGSGFCRFFIEEILRQALYSKLCIGRYALANCNPYSIVAADQHAWVGGHHYLFDCIHLPGCARHKKR